MPRPRPAPPSPPSSSWKSWPSSGSSPGADVLANLWTWFFQPAGPQTHDVDLVLAAETAAIHDEGSVELNSHLDVDARAAFLADGVVTRDQFAELFLGAAAGCSTQATVGKGT